MKDFEFEWWKNHRYKYGRPVVQDERSSDEWRALAKYAEDKLEEAYRLGYVSAQKDKKNGR